ncbi:MAG: hypothetical protein DMF79_19830, partial [Acidobacteria bacterium]
MTVVDPRSARSVEDGQRVGQAVAGEGENGFVHHHHRDLAVGDRLAGRIAQVEVQDGRSPGTERRLPRRDAKRERALARRHPQLQLPRGERGARRGLRLRLAGLVGARGRPHDVDLDVDVGGEALLDRD